MKFKELIAHSKNQEGSFHTLHDHIVGVATLARDFAEKLGVGELGWMIAMYHDIGKISPLFQGYLKGKESKGGDHKGAGALLIKEVAEFLTFPVAGHHGGLPDFEHLKRLLRETSSETVERARGFLSELQQELIPYSPKNGEWLRDPLKVEFLIRMIFSALVDADFLDTERHFNPTRTVQREKSWSIDGLWRLLAKAQSELSGKDDSLVNQERHRIYLACLESAAKPQGFFRLTVPTGGGKTRSAMAFALQHALQHKLDRVIMAIPYTSITDQTADVYRGIFGGENVLEHHSAAAWHAKDDERSDGLSWQRLASENWDVPIVVTTNVQLFESLLGNKPSACRKLHNIARSVIILDEVQTLPLRLLDPTLDVLRQLVERYHVTLVLCTATQPAFEANPIFDDLPEINEIVPDTRGMFQRLARVSYQLPSPGETWDWEHVAQEMRLAQQALAVVNTKGHAQALFDSLKDPEALLLSTNLCGAHRRNVIAEVKNRLTKSEPCRLVSTQVVEAGVDIDFPLVLRAVGPLDRIVQAAGRCNREGSAERGRMVVFRPQDTAMPPGEYRSATDITTMLISEGDFDPDDPATIEKYSRHLLQTVSTDSKVEGATIQEHRCRFNYLKVAESYQLIADSSIPVIVRYDAAAENLVDQLCASFPGNVRRIIRKLQPYIVNLYQHQIDRAAAIGLVTEIFPGMMLWTGKYKEKTGIDIGGFTPKDLVQPS